jgi:putative holliday junction resolvase
MSYVPAHLTPKTLGIDFGTKRVGLAISHGFLAEPYKTIENNLQLFENIKQICLDEGIEKLVVGISENIMAQKTKKFAKKLEKELSMPVEFVDETLSSQEAMQKLKLTKRTKSITEIDHYAAAHFLQGWLDEHE